MKEAINLLKHLYSESVPDIANILVAEAENDKELILHYLDDLKEYIDGLIEKIKKDDRC